MSSRFVFAASLSLAVILAAGCGKDQAKGKPGDKPVAQEALLIHVGGTMHPAIEELCKLYTAETGQKVEINKNDSGALMAAIEQTKKGDIYVAHDPFPVRMEKQGLAEKTYLVASLTPVIVVKKGNPKGIKGIQDLTRDDIKVGLTDEKYSTLGWILPVVFKKAGIDEAMGRKNVARARSGGEMANSVMVGANDAAIVWNAVAFNRKDGLDAIEIYPQFRPDAKADAISSATYGTLDISRVAVAAQILKCSKQPENARKLAELINGERGRAVFARHGFSVAPAAPATDASVDKPAAE